MAVQMNEELENLCLHQIHREFADICLLYGVGLEPPVMKLTSSNHCFGVWDPVTRSIGISVHLVASGRWDQVVQVLKHEMAHQMSTDLFGVRRLDHGEIFQRCARMIGLDPVWCGADSDLASGPVFSPASATTEAGRRVLARIQKLLALAGSDNEHEAALAMQKARALQAAWNLEQIEECQYRSLVITTGRRRLAGHQLAIAALLADFFQVRVIVSTLYDPAVGESFKTFELLGRDENVLIAEHCYHFLENRLHVLWQQNRARFQGNALRARNSYYLGLLKGFREKLQDREQEPTGQVSAGEARALQVAADARLELWVKFRFPRLARRHRRRRTVYRDSFEEGRVAGRNLTLHRTVAEHTGSGRFLPPGLT
ncbi:SprT-like domain-containing protein [Desulfolithobacter sp.]